MPRTTKVVGFSVPPALAKEIMTVARREKRTKSELFREMFRVYKSYRKQRVQSDYDPHIARLWEEVQREERENPTSDEQMMRDVESLSKSMAKQAKRLGIKSEKDIERIIQEYRAENHV